MQGVGPLGPRVYHLPGEGLSLFVACLIDLLLLFAVTVSDAFSRTINATATTTIIVTQTDTATDTHTYI